MQMFYSWGEQYYAISGTQRECGLWLSVKRYPLPVPLEWRRPGVSFAAVMPGRDYYRIGTVMPQREIIAYDISEELIADFRDAAWWTPGLEEAWEAAAQAMKQLDELTRPSKEKKRA